MPNPPEDARSLSLRLSVFICVCETLVRWVSVSIPHCIMTYFTRHWIITLTHRSPSPCLNLASLHPHEDLISYLFLFCILILC